MRIKEKKCYDGYLVKGLDPVVFLMPHIMPRRTDSQVMTDLKFDLEKVEEFIRQQRKGDIPNLTLYHFVFAALVRAAFEYPQINRFIAGKRIYERRHVKVSMTVKKSLSMDGAESQIFPTFEKNDSLKDIVDKIQKSTEEALEESENENNGFDRLVAMLMRIPPSIIGGFVSLMLWMDRHGWLPKVFLDLQPFHSSFFVTNVGSIGLPVVYHHLYEFGTCSGFLAIGRKETVLRFNPKGHVEKRRVLPIRFVVDSRICDGYAYSCAFRSINRCFEHPERLLKSFEEFVKEKNAGQCR